jgi:uncharacterized DUF497 family protein
VTSASARPFTATSSLAYARRVSPGYVLERRDTRPYPEPRFQVIGEVLGEVLVVIYTPRDGACRLITAWAAEGFELDQWYDYLTR